MRMKKFHFYFVGSISFLALLTSFLLVRNLEEPRDNALAFISIGLDLQGLTTEVSSYEILRANEHFADIVLGWTVDPSFSSELERLWDADYSFSGLRQEKQNLIFEVYGAPSLAPAQELVGLIKSRLFEYDEATHSTYKVALEKYSTLEGVRSDSRLIFGATLLAFLLSGLGIFFWDYATRH